MKWSWDKFGHRPTTDALIAHAIPELANGAAEIRAVARDATSIKFAILGADLTDEDTCERISAALGIAEVQIVPWSDDPAMLIANSLQPAEVDDVLLCDMIGRAIVLVRADQLSVAIGPQTRNVRLASKLCGWDMEIMTRQEYERRKADALVDFTALDGVSEALAKALVDEGFLVYDDLSVIEPDALMKMAMGNVTPHDVEEIIAQAEQYAEENEHRR